MKRLLTTIVLLFLFSSSVITFAQSIEGRVVAWSLNVRSAPLVNRTNIIGEIKAQTVVIIEGRSAASDWLYIRNEDSSIVGWASARYIQFDTNQLNNVPVTSSAAPTQGTIAAKEPADDLSVPLNAGSQSQIMETPIFHNMTTSTVYTTFARGQRLGNRPNVFMKVGDSVTATQPFLHGFGTGSYSLGPHGSLQTTIDFFSVSPINNVPNSFVQSSVAAVNGFVSGAVFDGTWSPEYCGKLIPLDCEYDILRPSVAIVLFGGQDVRLFDARFFQTNMRKIAVSLKSLGVIPVFTTFPMHSSYEPEKTIQYNSIVIDIANEQDIPLINLYRALQPLPEGGAKPDDVVHLTQGGENDHFSFNGAEGQYGVTLRNLLTLQALDILRRDVLQR